MQLEKRTKNELKNIVLNNYTRELGESYIQDIGDIFNQDQLFSGNISISSNDKTKVMATSRDHFAITYNMLGIQEYYAKSYERQLKNNPNLCDIDFRLFLNYTLSYSVIHEIAHLFQLMCGNENVSTYLEVNSLYKEIFSSLKRTRVFQKKIYNSKSKHNFFCFERNANLTAAEILVPIFQDTDLEYYSQLVHLNNYLKPGYSMKHGNVISPVDFTTRYLPVKENINFTDLPFVVAFLHGFTISGKDYHYVYDEVLETMRNGDSVDYDDTMKRIRTLEKREKYQNEQY